MGSLEIRQECSRGIVTDADDGNIYTIWDIDHFLELVTDEACKWLERHQSNYIHTRSDGTSYISGRCLTDLRAYLQEL